MPGKLQHSQRGRNQINSTKTDCFAVFICVPASWWLSERRSTMSMLLYSCVCAKQGRRIKETWGQTPVMWFLTSSTPDEGRVGKGERQCVREARWERRLEQILPPTDNTRWPHYRVTLIRARPANYIPPVRFQHIPYSANRHIIYLLMVSEGVLQIISFLCLMCRLFSWLVS